MQKPNELISDQQWQEIQTKAKEIGLNPCTLLPLHKGFVKPTALDVIAFKQWTGYSTTAIAKMLGISPSRPKDWMATKNKAAFKPIVPAYWFYLLALFNVTEIEKLERIT